MGRIRTVGSVLTASAILLGTSACGGGDSSDDVAAGEPSAAASASPTASATPSVSTDGAASSADTKAIKALVTEIATSKDSVRICRDLVTGAFVKDLYGTQTACREDDDEEGTPTGATVSGITVTGTKATAQVALKGGDLDKASGAWSFVKQAGKWRLDEWSTQFLKSGFVVTFAGLADDDPTSPFSDKNFLDCISSEATKMSDEKFRELARAAFKDAEGADAYDELLRPCLLASADGKPSPIRNGFEQGFRQGDTGLTEEQVECVLDRLRTEITDVQIYELSKDQSGAGAAAVQEKTRAAALQCGAGKTGSAAASKAARASAATKAVPARD